MRRVAVVLAGLICVVAATAGPAAAESVTVHGSGDITKMFASNGAKAAVVKVYGLEAPCDAMSVQIKITSKRAGYYEADAGCYQGTWATGFFYYSSADDQNGTKVTCDGFHLRYNADRKFYKLRAPRSCLGHAPNKVRFESTGGNYGSAQPGAAGPTKLL